MGVKPIDTPKSKWRRIYYYLQQRRTLGIFPKSVSPHSKIVLAKSLSRLRLFVTPWNVYIRPGSCPWGFSRQKYWSVLPCPPPGYLPNLGFEPRSLALGCILYHLSHQGSPRILEQVDYPFSRETSWRRNRSGISCITGEFFTSWAIRETPNKTEEVLS